MTALWTVIPFLLILLGFPPITFFQQNLPTKMCSKDLQKKQKTTADLLQVVCMTVLQAIQLFDIIIKSDKIQKARNKDGELQERGRVGHVARMKEI